MIYSDETLALELWDNIDEDSSIFIPIILGGQGEKNYVFMETYVSKKEEHSWVRVFINKEEAMAYKKEKARKGLSIGTTSIIHFTSYLQKHCEFGKVDKKVECILSTIDVEGKFYNIDVIWNNYERDS